MLLLAYLSGCLAGVALWAGINLGASFAGGVFALFIALIAGGLRTGGPPVPRAWGVMLVALATVPLAFQSHRIEPRGAEALLFLAAAGLVSGRCLASVAGHPTLWPAALGGVLTVWPWMEVLSRAFGDWWWWLAVPPALFLSLLFRAKRPADDRLVSPELRSSSAAWSTALLLGAAWGGSTGLLRGELGDSLRHLHDARLLYAASCWMALGALVVLVRAPGPRTPSRALAWTAGLAGAGWLAVALAGWRAPRGGITHAVGGLFGLRPRDGMVHDLVVSSVVVAAPALFLGAALALLPRLGPVRTPRLSALAAGFLLAMLASPQGRDHEPLLDATIATTALVIVARSGARVGRITPPAPTS